ncbi:MAG TPA: hypothetical protein VFU26_05375 [Gaiellaceae bacterium]|nr:hypothetical protein [Gaiellaceae bacterium]
MAVRTRRRRFAWETLALGGAALVLSASAAPAPAAAPLTVAERSALLAQYMPILYFHSSEVWAPGRVERFLQLARVENQSARGTWTRPTASLPTNTVGCSFSPCYRFNLPCSLENGARCYTKASASLSDWKQGSVYGRLIDVPARTPFPAGITVRPKYLLRYWLFYALDDWRSRTERLWQAHEGDWETVSVALDDELRPIFAAYSQHCSGTIRPWARVRHRDMHPVVYVALGSHANYFEPISSPTQFLRCVYRNVAAADRTKARRIVNAVQSGITDRTGTVRLLDPTAAKATLELVELTAPLPPWARFPGRWSEGELLWAGRTPTRFTRVRSGLGPATPKWSSSTIPSLWHSDSS